MGLDCFWIIINVSSYVLQGIISKQLIILAISVQVDAKRVI